MANFVTKMMEVFSQSALFTSENGLKAKVTMPEEKSPIVLVAGDNASGKSLLCRMVRSYTRKEENLSIREVSMADRNGKHYMSNVMNYGRYGDEDRSSTGNFTFTRIVKDIQFFKESKEDFFFILDEPDMGLSESYMKALGKYLADETANLLETGRCQGIILITHNKLLINTYTQWLQNPPVGIYLGEEYTTFKHWYETQSDKSVDDLLSLRERTKENHKAFTPLIQQDKDAGIF